MREVLKMLAKGEISVEEAEKLLRVLAIQEIEDIAKLDQGRELRKGIPEIVLAEGKTPEEVRDIALTGVTKMGRIIISRTTKDQVEAVRQAITPGLSLESDKRMRTIVIRKNGFTIKKTGGKIGILTAGTSDIPIAEEAKIVAQEMGCEVMMACDVGVAGDVGSSVGALGIVAGASRVGLVVVDATTGGAAIFMVGDAIAFSGGDVGAAASKVTVSIGAAPELCVVGRIIGVGEAIGAMRVGRGSMPKYKRL